MRVIEASSLFTGVIESLFFSGAIYGWPSLQYVLMEEGYFRELCNVSNANDSNNATEETALVSCPEMMERFNLVFTLAIAALCLSTWPFGIILDRYGTWVMRSIATTIYSTAFILLSVMSAQTSWLLFPAMAFIAVGGIQLLISNLQLGNFATTFRFVCITLVSGAFDSAALTFLIVKLIYDNQTDLNLLLTVIACLTALPWLRTYLLMPRATIPFPKPPHYKFGVLECQQAAKHEKVQETKPDVDLSLKSSNESEEDVSDWKTHLRTILFWSNLIHFSINHLRFNFFVSSFVSWLETHTEDGSQISFNLNLLGFMFLGGLAVGPLSGSLVDSVINFCKKRVKSENKPKFCGLFASAVATSSFSVLLSVSVLIPNIYLALIFAVLVRAFLYGGLASFVALAFPSQHFGKLYGITQTVGGLSTFLQYALFSITTNIDQSFIGVNYTLLCCSILTLIHPILIWKNRVQNNEVLL